MFEPYEIPNRVEVRTLFVLGVRGGVLPTETRVPDVSRAV